MAGRHQLFELTQTRAASITILCMYVCIGLIFSRSSTDVKDDAKDVNAEARDKKDSIILDECVECSEVNEDGDSILFNDSIDREVAELTENNSNSFSSTYIKVNKEC